MKQLRQLCLGAILLLALAVPAFPNDAPDDDGKIGCPIAPPSVVNPEPAPGTDGGMESGVLQAAISIIQSMILLS